MIGKMPVRLYQSFAAATGSRNSQPTSGWPSSTNEGGRGAMKPSMSPRSSRPEIVAPSGALSSRTPGGSFTVIFSGRPGSSMPPRIQWMSAGITP
jgi:hypothetical protein